MPKSQTSTEYLIIVAVVIIIAVIVIGVLGGIPGIGGNIGDSSSQIALATQSIGISGVAVSDYRTQLTLQNNNKFGVEVTGITLNGEDCFLSSNLNFNIASGKELVIECISNFELADSRVDWDIAIQWTNKDIQASYSQSDSELRIIENVANQYLSVIQSNDYWNVSINGCYDNTTDPVPICTCVDLNKTRWNLGLNYTLQNSIDFVRCEQEFGADFITGSGWDPVGYDFPNYFTGHFYGENRSIGNLFISREATTYVGLFGALVGGAYDLVIHDANITGNNGVGALAGAATGGYGTAEIRNIYVLNGFLNGTNNVGGLVGATGGMQITNVGVENQISQGEDSVGGLIGDSGNDEITNSYAYSIVSGTTKVGGFIGEARTGMTFNNIRSISDVSASSSRAGGLIGDINYVSYGTLDNSYAIGNVSSPSQYVGGLAGLAAEAIITNSYAEVVVAGATDVGGLLGDAYAGSTLISSSWKNFSGDSADDCVGGGSLAPDASGECSLR